MTAAQMSFRFGQGFLRRAGEMMRSAFADAGNDVPVPEIARPTLSEARRNQCRWIEGDSTYDVPVCGKPTIGRTAWCAEHHKRVYVRQVPPK